MRLKASVPPPATAGPPLGLAAMATAVAVPLAVIDALRQAPMRISPAVDVSVGRSANVTESSARTAASTLLSMSLRERLRPTEMALEAPVVLAATLIALAATSALIAVLDTDSTTMSPTATESRARSMLATVSAAILFIAITGATEIALAWLLAAPPPAAPPAAGRSTTSASAEFSTTASMAPSHCAETSTPPETLKAVLSVQARVVARCTSPKLVPSTLSAMLASRFCGA